MKYLHSGYVLFCDRADHAEDGRVDAHGIFDLFASKSLPMQMNCCCIIAFGTPYERRQYKGLFILEDPDGKELLSKEFDANDPNDLYRGHYIFRPQVTLFKEGLYVVKVSLKNWKGDGVWEVERKFWVMREGDRPLDP